MFICTTFPLTRHISLERQASFDRIERRSMGLREGLARKRLCGDVRPPSEIQLKALEVRARGVGR